MWASVMRRIETATRGVACMRRDWMAAIVGDNKPSHVVSTAVRALRTSRLDLSGQPWRVCLPIARLCIHKILPRTPLRVTAGPPTSNKNLNRGGDRVRCLYPDLRTPWVT